MNLFFASIEKNGKIVIATSIIYMIAMFSSIVMCNSNTLINYKICLYAYAAEPIDFVFGLLVSVPFAISTYYLKKDNFLSYVDSRIQRKKYLQGYISGNLLMCFCMVFWINLISVIFSCYIANVEPFEEGINNSLSGYLLGELQMEMPILFGVLWSIYKGILGVIICFFAQVISLYEQNFFLAMLIPFAYLALENFATAIMGLSKISFTSSFILNRLSMEATSFGYLLFGIGSFIAIMSAISIYYRGRYEKSSK